MAASFRIVMHQNSGNLHLRLMGDFDGSSAFELLELLKQKAQTVQKVFTRILNSLFDIRHSCFAILLWLWPRACIGRF
jgi:hypothetical protein